MGQHCPCDALMRWKALILHYLRVLVQSHDYISVKGIDECTHAKWVVVLIFPWFLSSGFYGSSIYKVKVIGIVYNPMNIKYQIYTIYQIANRVILSSIFRNRFVNRFTSCRKQALRSRKTCVDDLLLDDLSCNKESNRSCKFRRSLFYLTNRIT